MTINWKISKKQQRFICRPPGEVLFGGAAGGGKSYGQLIDAFIYAQKYKKSKQLILRRTYGELERSLIRVSQEIYPYGSYSYNTSKHTMTFKKNKSIIDFGYIDGEGDLLQYQSAEYDVIRFDELTHFTEYMYVYMLSRLRGANGYPKSIKSSTNPGNVGHNWVKKRFILPCPAGEVFQPEVGMPRIFIPSLVTDNKALIKADPGYIQRLKSLPEKDQQMLLYGNWDVFEGAYFDEFSRDVHVIKPFPIPRHWNRYISFDYGLDMLAAYEMAVDESGMAYVVKEYCKSNLIISQAAKAVKELAGGDDILRWFAPPDLWNRRQDTGKSVADIFAENGVYLTQVSNDRVSGWYNVKEYLHPFEINGRITANLQIFQNCTELIDSLPSLQHSSTNPNDTAKDPHDITHSPDALRYFVAGRPVGRSIQKPGDEDIMDYDEQVNNFLNYY